jgi:hypothetical protein
MIKTKKNIEYSIVCGPLTKFLLMNLILRPALQFEFDMSALDEKNTSALLSGSISFLCNLFFLKGIENDQTCTLMYKLRNKITDNKL